jgi:hypothetical protein
MVIMMLYNDHVGGWSVARPCDHCYAAFETWIKLSPLINKVRQTNIIIRGEQVFWLLR